MNCPVCGGMADDVTPHTIDGRGIHCSACGEYDVSGSIYDPGTLQKRRPAAAISRPATKRDPRLGARPPQCQGGGQAFLCRRRP
jgi:hypothetical protein